MMTPSRLCPLLRAGLLATCLAAAGSTAAQDKPAAGAAPGAGRSSRYDAQQIPTAEKIQILTDKLAAEPMDGPSWHDLGTLYAGLDNFVEARDAFIHAVQCDKHNSEFHRSLGLAFVRLEMPEMALNEFNEYRRLDPFGGRDFWRMLGGSQRKAGRIDEARLTFRDGLKEQSEPPHPEMFRLVLALRDLETEAADTNAVRRLLADYVAPAQAHLDSLAGGADPTAADGYGEAAAIVQATVVMALEDAKAAEEAGDLTAAAARCEEVRRLAPERDEMLPRLVDLYLRLGRLEEAEKTAAAACLAQPELASSWLASGLVHEQATRLPEALAAYEQAWKLERDEDLRVAIGNLYVRLGRDQEAAEWLRSGVTATTKPEVVYNYAVILMRAGKFPEAITQLQRVVRERPQMASGWQALAACLQSNGQLTEAITAGEQALALQPDPKVAFLLGNIAQKAKQYDKAIAAYQQALSLHATYDNAQYNLALTFMEAKRYAEAVTAFDQLVQIEGVTYRAYYSQGLSYYYLGKYTEALDAFDTAMTMEETVNVFNNIGLTWDKLGDKAEAAAWYQKAKDLKNAPKP